MLASKSTRTVSRPRRALVLLLSAVLIAAVFPIVAVAVDGYRADTGSYAEEGFGLLPEFLPFTEVEYRADTGSYAEEGLGLLPEFLPFTEIEYRADTGSYAEEGFGSIR